MTPRDLIDDLRSRINLEYADTLGTESYERKLCADALEDQADELDELREHKVWISVEDQMPAPRQSVLIAYMTYSAEKTVTIGWYTPAKTTESSYFEGDVDDEYDEANDTFYLKEQWVDESRESEYHCPISGVTHWMPLPSPPQ